MNRCCATPLRAAPKIGLLPVGRRDPLWHLASGEMTSYEGAASPARGGTEPGPAIDRGRTLPAGDGRRLRVLLLDGQDLVHWGFKTLLAAEHWVERFVAAHSADEAIELARRHAPHVAVVDLAAATDRSASSTPGSAAPRPARGCSSCPRATGSRRARPAPLAR